MRKDSKLQKEKFRTKRHQMQENCYLPVFFAEMDRLYSYFIT